MGLKKRSDAPSGSSRLLDRAERSAGSNLMMMGFHESSFLAGVRPLPSSVSTASS